MKQLMCAFVGLAWSLTSWAATPVERILQHWQSPSSDYVMVVAHRAAFMENGQIILPENSLPAIAYAIALGVDMVELDIQATKDGRFVLIHDATVDRTTDGSGAVKDMTFAELRQLRLIDEVTGERTEYRIPSLEEVYAMVKDQIMVNLDPKLNISQLTEALEIAKAQGVERQIILKEVADTPAQLAAIETLMAELSYPVDFMPMHWDKNGASLQQLRNSFERIQPQAAEMVVGLPQQAKVARTPDGGVLFSPAVKRLAKEYDVHLWVNTLYVDPLLGKPEYLQWNGGRHDVLGLKYPDQVFGFWAEQGATIMQTDEPKFLLDYLKQRGLRTLAP